MLFHTLLKHENTIMYQNRAEMYQTWMSWNLSYSIFSVYCHFYFFMCHVFSCVDFGGFVCLLSTVLTSSFCWVFLFVFCFCFSGCVSASVTLHGYSYCRNKSAVLFDTILCIADLTLSQGIYILHSFQLQGPSSKLYAHRPWKTMIQQ